LVQFLSVDVDSTPAPIFHAIDIGDVSLEEEPFIMDVEGDFNQNVVFYPMGHYREPSLSIDVQFGQNEDIQIVYDCVFNPQIGDWAIVRLSNSEPIELTPVDYEAFSKYTEVQEIGTIHNNKKKVALDDNSKWHSIVPFEDCPHAIEFCTNSQNIAPQFKLNQCDKCGDKSENWYCLTCGKTYCSRYVNSHGLEHYNETGHALLMSYTDLSTWCYLCDYYIVDQSCTQALYLLHLTKFGVPHAKDKTAGYFSRYYCNICRSLIQGTVIHCKDCEDFDLCTSCHAKGEYPDPHTNEHNVEEVHIH